MCYLITLGCTSRLTTVLYGFVRAQTSLAACSDCTDAVVVTDGGTWPFVPPAQQTAALTEWTEFRASVPYLQLHFVAINTTVTKTPIAGGIAGRT
jgi:hypothetical protein